MAESYTVLYITSLSHSGSTLLDLLLSTHSLVTGVGEVKVLSEKVRAQRRKQDPKGRDPLDGRCACRVRPILACSFWHRVDETLHGRRGLRLADLDLMDDDPVQFREHNEAFFSAVHAVTGSSYIVDLSKDLTRLKRLMEYGPFEVRPIHILRNPCGVVYSHMKKERDWFTQACKCRTVLRRAGRVLDGMDCLRVSYEQLAAAPRESLVDIMQWVGLPFEEGQLGWAAGEHHHIAGNRLRRLRSDEIRIDDAWRDRLSAFQKLCISFVARPSWPGYRTTST